MSFGVSSSEQKLCNIHAKNIWQNLLPKIQMVHQYLCRLTSNNYPVL